MYSVCYCTLAGTKSCEKCPNNTWSDWVSGGWNLQKWVETWNGTSYDTNRYELVEKKDWKLNQLKKELESANLKSTYLSKGIDNDLDKLKEYQKEIDSLEKEIKDLEQ
jgi:peptidoglycan hydrolase CwlO-like protein